MEHSAIEALVSCDEYRQLVRSRRRFSFLMTALMICTYYGFVLVVALAPHVLAVPLYRGATATVGIVVGVGAIVVALGLTLAYVLRANRAFDRSIDVLLERA